MSEAAFFVDEALVSSTRFYATACDPRRSVSVQACAGSGKTWMLVARIVRALLEGVEPSSILAITFTRKAAAEMNERLVAALDELAKPSLSDQAITQMLVDRGLDETAAMASCAAARGLAQRVARAGQGVQVRTIHGWFATLLDAAPQAFRLQHGIPDGLHIIEDDAALLEQVQERILARMAQGGEGRAEFEWLVQAHGRSQALLAMQQALKARADFIASDAAGVLETSVDPMAHHWPQWGHLQQPEMAVDDPAFRARWTERASAWVRASAGAGKPPGKRVLAVAAAIEAAWQAPDAPQRLHALNSAIATQQGKLRDCLQDIADAHDAMAEIDELIAAATHHKAWLHHQVLTRLCRILVAEHQALKLERGWIDMVDIERLAHALLCDPVCSGYVQERLDARYAQVLVDEFQDTNPVQWQALAAWLQSYAGAGGPQPSVFIVGDPKQSIYSFRGAEPAVFEAARDVLSEVFDAACLRTDHTRRCSRAVVEAVNTVLPPLLQGLGQAEGDAFSVHTTESDRAGSLLRFEQVPRPVRAPRKGRQGAASEDGPAWRDALREPAQEPEEHVHDLACGEVADWIANALAGGREPGSIMVLARQRERLARMAEQLRQRGIGFDQPERSQLRDSPAARDMVALIDVLVSPAHDLSLAQALRSPLFGWTDAQLMALAELARGTPEAGGWLASLQAGLHPADGQAPLSDDQASAARRLRRWQGWLAAWPLHDVLAAIYDEIDVLALFARRAPPGRAAQDVLHLRTLLQASLAFEAGRFVTPYAFVRAFRQGHDEAFRVRPTAPGNTVHLLTVHGAKGLEAEVVIVLDADAGKTRGGAMGSVCKWSLAATQPTAFAFVARESQPPRGLESLMAARAAVQAREEINALYVAMTRAKDQLLFSSVMPHASPQPHSWWRALLAAGVPFDVLGASAEQAAPVPPKAQAQTFWLELLPKLPEAIVQSRMDAVVFNDVCEPRSSRDERWQAAVGTAMHRLLQWVPLRDRGWDRSGPSPWAGNDIDALASQLALSAQGIERAVDAARSILAGEGRFAWDASAVRWAGSEVPVTVDGTWRRIDRLVQTHAGCWWVLDFKLAGDPAGDPALAAQLTAYVQAVRQGLVQADVRAAFLTARGERIEWPRPGE